jgi:hypothetical protein
VLRIGVIGAKPPDLTTACKLAKEKEAVSVEVFEADPPTLAVFNEQLRLNHYGMKSFPGIY